METAARDDGTEVVYYHMDRLGSPKLITDINRNIIRDRDFGAFGDVIQDSGSASDDHDFTGHRDGEHGLTYMHARWYDEELGRFISADTIVSGLGNPQALDRYSYTYNNPVNFVDPSGHFIQRPFLSALGAVGNVYSYVAGSVSGTISFGMGGSAGANFQGGSPAGALFDVGGEGVSKFIKKIEDKHKDIGKKLSKVDKWLNKKLSPLSPKLKSAGDIANKGPNVFSLRFLWNLPNTALGMTVGLSGLPFGAKMGKGYGMVTFRDHYLPRAFELFSGNNRFDPILGTTLGDVAFFRKGLSEDFTKYTINYGGGFEVTMPVENVGYHEYVHSRQYRVLGPLWFPFNNLFSPLALITNSYDFLGPSIIDVEGPAYDANPDGGSKPF